MGAITILPVAAILAVRLRRPVEEVIAPVIFGVITILYLSGLLTTLMPGVWICHLLSAGAFLLCIRAWITNRASFRSNVFTCGMLAYFVFFVYFLLISYGRDIYVGDDCHRWAAAVRDFYVHKDMFNLPDNYDTHYFYPPALPLWNYYSMEVLRGYHDWSSFLSQYMLQTATALPLFSKLCKGKSRRYSVPMLLLTILCIPLVTGCFFPYGNLHDGIPQGFLGAYILWKGSDYHESKARFDLICCAMAVGVLTLTKEIALSVAVICVFTLFLAGWKDARRFHELRRLFLSTALCVVVCIAALASWQYYLYVSDKVYATTTSAFTGEAGLIASSDLTGGMLYILSDDAIPMTRIGKVFRSLLNVQNKDTSAAETLISFTKMIFHPSSGAMNPSACLNVSLPAFLLILLCLAIVLSYSGFASKASPPDKTSNHYLTRLLYLTFIFCIPLCILSRGMAYAINPQFLTSIWGEHTDTFSVIGALFFLYYILRQRDRQFVSLLCATSFIVLSSGVTDLALLPFDKPQNTILAQSQDSQEALPLFSSEDTILYLDGNERTTASVYDHDLVYYYAYPARSRQVNISPSTADVSAGDYLIQLMLNRGYNWLYFAGGYPAYREQLLSAFAPDTPVLDYGLYRLEQNADGSSCLHFVRQDLPNSISWRIRRNYRFHLTQAPE